VFVTFVLIFKFILIYLCVICIEKSGYFLKEKSNSKVVKMVVFLYIV